jgi:hypothetical protein
MGISSGVMPATSQAVQQAASQLPQRTNMVEQPVTGGASMFGGNAQPSAQQAAQAISGGKGGQPPSPQALSQGLQQQAAMQSAVNAGKGGQPPAPSGSLGSFPAVQAAIKNAAQAGSANMQNPQSAAQTPMTMQRQPQGGMAGRTAQIQNSSRAALGSLRRQ